MAALNSLEREVITNIMQAVTQISDQDKMYLLGYAQGVLAKGKADAVH